MKEKLLTALITATLISTTLIAGCSSSGSTGSGSSITGACTVLGTCPAGTITGGTPATGGGVNVGGVIINVGNGEGGGPITRDITTIDVIQDVCNAAARTAAMQMGGTVPVPIIERFTTESGMFEINIINTNTDSSGNPAAINGGIRIDSYTTSYVPISITTPDSFDFTLFPPVASMEIVRLSNPPPLPNFTPVGNIDTTFNTESNRTAVTFSVVIADLANIKPIYRRHQPDGDVGSYTVTVTARGTNITTGDVFTVTGSIFTEFGNFNYCAT